MKRNLKKLPNDKTLLNLFYIDLIFVSKNKNEKKCYFTIILNAITSFFSVIYSFYFSQRILVIS